MHIAAHIPHMTPFMAMKRSVSPPSIFSAPPPVVCTPLPPPQSSIIQPPVVPALKIVKRAQKFAHQKSNSSGSASSSDSATDSAAQLMMPVTQVRKVAIVESLPSKPLSYDHLAPGRWAGPGRLAAMQKKTATVVKPDGPRRVVVAETQPTAGRPTVSTIMGAGGPRRVALVPPVAPVGPTITRPTKHVPTSSQVGGSLRPPTRYGGNVSALPRPVNSYKVTPTTQSNLRIPSKATGTGTATGRGVRMAYGN